MNIYRGLKPEHIKALNLVSMGDSGRSGSHETVKGNPELLKDGFRVYDNKKLVGWAAVFQSYSFWGNAGYETHFFVHPKYRRNKIGSRLFSLCKRLYPHMRVSPWDSRSLSFFNKVRSVQS